MSSQRMWHKLRKSYKNAIRATRADDQAWKMLQRDVGYWLNRCLWLERRPPWWAFWRMKKWREEEPRE